MIKNIFENTWLVIPLYNEAEVIESVIIEAIKVFPQIVCVDDGSSDNCGALANECGAWLITHPINLGQGAAIQTGLDFAKTQPGSKYFVTFDSDGQHSVLDAKEMVKLLDRDNDLDIVIGSRFLDNNSNVSLTKKTVLKMAVFFEKMRTGMKLTDAHNGLRALNYKAASKINITQNRMAHASEITAQVAEHKLNYSEFPVTITYTDYSKRKGQSIWNSINILSDLWVK